MPNRILVVDYSEVRCTHLKDRLRARFSAVEVFELATDPPGRTPDVRSGPLNEIKANQYDILIGHLGGNPSGYECLRTFKASNPKGKVVLYTKSPSISLDQFEGLKLANAVFQRAEDDTKVFANDDQMLAVVERILKEPGLVHWTSPFRDKAVWLAALPLLTALIGLVAAVVKLTGG